MRKTLIAAAVAFTALAGASQAAHAAQLAVMPVAVALNAKQDRQSLTLENQGAERILLQVEAVAWSQKDGVDQFTPTTDLVVNPPVFAIEAGKSQLVRVGLRAKPQGPHETTYRLIVRQVPAAPDLVPNADDPGQVRVLLQVRLPVYVAPANPQRSQQWSAWKTPEGNVAVEMQNTGTVHQTITSLDVRDGKESRGGVRASAAVLAGQTRRWEFKPSDARMEQVVLEAATDAGLQRVPLTIQTR